MLSTGTMRHRQALAISRTVQRSGPSAPACSRIQTRRACWLAPLSLRTVSAQVWRALSASWTMYFLAWEFRLG